jgi:hypothetical protein
MSTLPEITGPDRQKPLCYDPERDKFIYFDDIITGKEKIVPLDKLNHEQLKKLVIERNQAGPDYTMQVLSGLKYTRDDVIKEIRKQSDFGKMSMQAEVSYLSDLLRQIDEALK